MQSESHKISIDDAALVERCRAGDSAAFEHLILKYQGRIYNTILKICSNSDDAAELTQDTFVKVIENIDKFAGRSSFYTWLFRIAVNLTLNFCKRNVKLGLCSLDSITESREYALKEYLQDHGSPDPVKVLQRQEARELVMAAIMKLDEDQRAVLVLRDIEAMSYAEISEVLELELGTVKSRLSRARVNLKEIIEVAVQ